MQIRPRHAFFSFALLAVSACRPAAPPPTTQPPEGAAPAGNVMGGKPTAAPAAAPKPGDFEKAIAIEFAFDKARSAVVAKIHLEPGFHAYGPREQTGRPLALDVAPDGWSVKEVNLPPGTEKDLGELGKSYVVTGDVEAVAVVEPKADAKAPVHGALNYQVCTATSCDRPRTKPFTVSPSS